MTREKFFTVNEIAEEIKVSPETVRRWLRTGQLAGHNFGGPAGWRVKESDLDAFLEEHHLGKRAA